MRVDWQQIVDVARGLADAETRLAVEADPIAREHLAAMRAVVEAAETAAPESFVNRAKALQPRLGKPLPTLRARLVFASADAAGLRSSSALSQDLRFESELGSIELRTERRADGLQQDIVGIFGGKDPQTVSVTVEGSPRVWCDEDGQFELTAPATAQTLTFVHALQGVILEVVLK